MTLGLFFAAKKKDRRTGFYGQFDLPLEEVEFELCSWLLLLLTIVTEKLSLIILEFWWISLTIIEIAFFFLGASGGVKISIEEYIMERPPLRFQRCFSLIGFVQKDWFS